MEAQLQSFLISAPDGVEWTTACPSHCTLVGKNTGTHWTEKVWTFRKRYKFAAHTGMRAQDSPACSTTAIQEQRSRRGNYREIKRGQKMLGGQMLENVRNFAWHVMYVCVNTTQHGGWILSHDTRLETITVLCEIMRCRLLRPEIIDETWVGGHH